MIAWLAAIGLASAAPAADAPTAEQVAFFEAGIRPIFVEHCWKCHAEDAKGGLRLDGREAALAGGDSGPAIVPGDAARSLVVRAVRYDDPACQMPPTGRLPAAAIRAIEEWVAAGAAYPAGAGGAAVRRGEFAVSDADRDHWAYRPIVRPPVPGTGATAMDGFLEEKLAARGIVANASATPRELVRRAWFDFGRQCLVARRLVERGVRFVQIYSGGGHQQQNWDAHFGVEESLAIHCPEGLDHKLTGVQPARPILGVVA